MTLQYRYGWSGDFVSLLVGDWGWEGYGRRGEVRGWVGKWYSMGGVLGG